MRPLTLNSTAGTLAMTISLLLCIPAYVICDLGLRAGRGPTQGIYVHVRTAASASVQAAPGILIYVRSKNMLDARGRVIWLVSAVELDGVPTPSDRLGVMLRQELSRRARDTVYVSGDGDLSWGDVVEVIEGVKAETGCRVVLLGRQYSRSSRYPD